MPAKRSSITRIIEAYKDSLLNFGIHVQKVILFGSHAKGAAHQFSDIDLIVVSNDFRSMNLRQRLEILGIAAARIMKPIEAKGYTAAELKKASPVNFLGEALSSGVVV